MTIKESFEYSKKLADHDNISMSPDMIQAINESLLPDSYKIIEYLEMREKKSRPSNIAVLVCSIIAAVTGIIALALQFI